MENKLQIYYQPAKNENALMKSLSISYYEFDVEHNTYREKIVLEKDGEKYKIKRYWGTLGSFLPKISKINLSQYPKTEVDLDKEYFYVKFGDQILATNNKEDIADILSIVNFDEILAYDITQYQRK